MWKREGTLNYPNRLNWFQFSSTLAISFSIKRKTSSSFVLVFFVVSFGKLIKNLAISVCIAGSGGC